MNITSCRNHSLKLRPYEEGNRVFVETILLANNDSNKLKAQAQARPRKSNILSLDVPSQNGETTLADERYYPAPAKHGFHADPCRSGFDFRNGFA